MILKDDAAWLPPNAVCDCPLCQARRKRDELVTLLRRWLNNWDHEHGDLGPSDWQACAKATRELLEQMVPVEGRS